MKLLGISGSLRRESTNTKLVLEAARVSGTDRFKLADIDLPLFNEDVEAEGLPDGVARLMDQIESADALVISTPEYNKAPPGALKNALDWVSRRRPMPTVGKPVAVISASAGIAGGQRAKFALYLMLMAFDVRLIPNPEVNLGASAKKFDEAGRLTDETAEKLLTDLMGKLRAAV